MQHIVLWKHVKKKKYSRQLLWGDQCCQGRISVVMLCIVPSIARNHLHCICKVACTWRGGRPTLLATGLPLLGIMSLMCTLCHISCTLHHGTLLVWKCKTMQAQECQSGAGTGWHYDCRTPAPVYYHSIRFTYPHFSQNNNSFATSRNQRQNDQIEKGQC